MPRPKIPPPEYLLSLDRLPSRERMFDKLRKSLIELADYYGFDKIYTPVIDDARAYFPLFKAGMLDWRPPVFCKTRTGNEILLRPSGLLSILRSYISHKMQDRPHPFKFYFEGDSFFTTAGRDKKIEGRPEWGLIMLGEEGPIAEAEMIQVLWKAFERIEGLDMNFADVRVNAAGCSECRSSFRSAISSYFRSRQARLCKNCRRYLKKSPTRILRCSEEKCAAVSVNAPQVLDFLCDTCKKHLRGFLEFLDEAKIPYFLDTKFFLEGSWYTTLIFEVSFREKVNPASKEKISNSGTTTDVYSAINPRQDEAILGEIGVEREYVKEKEIERQVALLGGGRMSKAASLMVGHPLEAAGLTVFFDALEEYLGRRGVSPSEEIKSRVFLSQLGDLAKRKSLVLLETLRANGIEVREALGKNSIKSQLKMAEKMDADITLILGQKEALDNTIIVRETFSGIQETIPQEKLIEFLKRKLKK
jgi:histidyl-tRNA synthetase